MMYSPRSVSIGVVERDFLGHHRFGLGDRPGAAFAGQVDDDPPGIGGGRCPVDMAAARLDLGGEPLKIDVEMAENVVLDVAGLVAQRLEFRQRRRRRRPLGHEAVLDLRQGCLKLGIAHRPLDVVFELMTGRLHRSASGGQRRRAASAVSPIGAVSVMPARTSATCRT
jgi:hypothetical protein